MLGRRETYIEQAADLGGRVALLNALEAVPRRAVVRVHLAAPSRLLHGPHQELVRPEHVRCVATVRVVSVVIPIRHAGVLAKRCQCPLPPRARAVPTAQKLPQIQRVDGRQRWRGGRCPKFRLKSPNSI